METPDYFSGGDEELLLDEAEAQRREFQRRERAAFSRSLAELLAVPQGPRFFALFLRRAGIGQSIGADQASVALRNEAVFWLRALARANPQAAASLLANALLDGGLDAGLE